MNITIKNSTFRVNWIMLKLYFCYKVKGSNKPYVAVSV